jgi:hypothetical protein
VNWSEDTDISLLFAKLQCEQAAIPPEFQFLEALSRVSKFLYGERESAKDLLIYH